MQMYSPTAASSAITGIPSRSESVAQLPVAQWGLPACCRALAWAPLDLSSTAIPALVASLPWVDQSVPGTCLRSSRDRCQASHVLTYTTSS